MPVEAKKPKKQRVICVCCDFECMLDVPDPDCHVADYVHNCPECGCRLSVATETTRNWHV